MPLRDNSRKRPQRNAAIKALEKIKAIAKEAEKYDDYGEEIPEELINFNVPITSSNWSVQAMNAARSAAAKNAPKDVSTWPNDDSARAAFAARVASSNSTEPEPPKTPDTIHAICSSDNIKYNAYEIYITQLKSLHVENIKKYLILSDNSDMKYIAIPELIKYLIANPSIIIHHSVFGEVIVNKMIEFENDIPTAKKIGSYTITEGYRKELLSLIKILKKLTKMHSKLNKMTTKEFYDNIETIEKEM